MDSEIMATSESPMETASPRDVDISNEVANGGVLSVASERNCGGETKPE